MGKFCGFVSYSVYIKLYDLKSFGLVVDCLLVEVSEEEGDWGGEGESSSVVVCKSVVCVEFAVRLG